MATVKVSSKAIALFFSFVFFLSLLLALLLLLGFPLHIPSLFALLSLFLPLFCRLYFPVLFFLVLGASLFLDLPSLPVRCPWTKLARFLDILFLTAPSFAHFFILLGAPVWRAWVRLPHHHGDLFSSLD